MLAINLKRIIIPMSFALLWAYGVFVSTDHRLVIMTAPLALLLIGMVSVDPGSITSVNFVYITVYFFFFVLAPIQNIIDGQSRLYNMFYFNGHVIFLTVFYITAFFLAYIFGYYGDAIVKYALGGEFIPGRPRGKPKKIELPQKESETGSSPPGTLVILAAILVCSAIYYKAAGGNHLISMGRTERSDLMLEPDALNSVIQTVSLSGVVISMCLAVVRIRSNQNRYANIAVLAVGVVILAYFQNPFNTARFYLIASWGPPLLTALFRSATKSRALIFMVIAVVFLMPILSVTTRTGKADMSQSNAETVEGRKVAYDDGLPRLTDNSLDVFDSFASSIELYEKQPLAMGKNTSVIFLHYVPRKMWPDKPYVLSKVMGDRLQQMGLVNTNNLSYFYAGDFLFDFGIVGLLFSGVATGFLVRFVDTRTLFSVNSQHIFRYVVICSLPILIRGPLGGVVSYFNTEIVICLALSFLLKFKFEFGKKRPGIKRVRHRHVRNRSR